MRRFFGILAGAAALAAGGCGPPTLGPPAASYRTFLQGFLQHATFDFAPANAQVVALVYTLPGPLASSPLDVRQVTKGRLPEWTTRHPLTGPDSLKQEGIYVGVITPTPLPGRVRYVARIDDPRDVRGELLNPVGSATLVRQTSGTYAVRVPFLSGSFAVGFTVDAQGDVSGVQYVLPLIAPPPFPNGIRFTAVHD